jgi:hypothetical protein
MMEYWVIDPLIEKYYDSWQKEPKTFIQTLKLCDSENIMGSPTWQDCWLAALPTQKQPAGLPQRCVLMGL